MKRTYAEIATLLREPVENVLTRNNILWKTKSAGSGTWYNLSRCPWCRHVQDKKGEYQCGVVESIGADGKLGHTVKCFHPHDADGDDSPKYEDWLFALGELTAEELADFKALSLQRWFNDGRPDGPSVKSVNPGTPRKLDGNDLKPLDLESNGRFMRRLFGHQAALDYLYGPGRGLTEETLRHFRCGLSRYYEARDQVDAWIMPIRGPAGEFYGRYMYYNIPGVTRNPSDANGWTPGKVATHYADPAGERRILIVCEGPKDLVRTWQAIQGTDLAGTVLLITSSHGSGIPDEWKEPGFWARWEVVYCAQDNDDAGNAMAENVYKLAGREVRRLLVPLSYGQPLTPGKAKKADLTDFWQHGGTVDLFRQLMADAEIMDEQVEHDGGDTSRPGYYSYKPVDIHGAYHNGFLYYTTERFVVTTDIIEEKSDGQEKAVNLMGTELLVIRSDRKKFVPYVPPFKGKNTSLKPVVMLRGDGALLMEFPKASVSNTWSWESIDRFLKGQSKPRALSAMVADALIHLRSRVYFKHDDDYILLALTVPLTYVQTVFEAVPLFLMLGPRETGKSRTGIAMHELCANSILVGQQSAASLARAIHETRGCVVLDDLEELGEKGKEFAELAQAIKLSYNQRTAVRMICDIKAERNKFLNFFGVKIIGNTRGVDDVLGSRMIKLPTTALPASQEAAFHQRPKFPLEKLSDLRDELHTWAMEHVAQVAATYNRLFPSRSNRANEIAAPLRVMAELTGDASIKAQLESALARQRRMGQDPEAPEQVLLDVVKEMIQEGYQMVSYQHLSLLMKAAMHENYGKEFSNQIAEWERPEWLKRQLGARVVWDRDLSRRQRIFGASRHNLRFYPIDRDFIDEVLSGHDLPVPDRGLTDFCHGCADCPFRMVHCPYQEERMQWEKTPKGRELAKAQRQRIEATETELRMKEKQRSEAAERHMRAALYRAAKQGEGDDNAG